MISTNNHLPDVAYNRGRKDIIRKLLIQQAIAHNQMTLGMGVLFEDINIKIVEVVENYAIGLDNYEIKHGDSDDKAYAYLGALISATIKVYVMTLDILGTGPKGIKSKEELEVFKVNFDTHIRKYLDDITHEIAKEL